MIKVITQIKSLNYSDLFCFLKYYTEYIKADKIILINDESIYDIRKLAVFFNNVIVIDRKDTNIPKGPASQEKVVNKIIEEYVDDTDIVITPDADEFFWYDNTKYDSFVDCCIAYFEKLKTYTVYVPWTLISNNTLLESRKPSQNYIETFKYIAKIPKIEYKPILCKLKTNKFEDMHYGNKFGKNIFNENERYNKFYRASINDWNNDLRLYHFRITTIQEYYMKFRGDPNINTWRGYAPTNINNFMKSLYNVDTNSFTELDETLLNIWKNINEFNF